MRNKFFFSFFREDDNYFHFPHIKNVIWKRKTKQKNMSKFVDKSTKKCLQVTIKHEDYTYKWIIRGSKSYGLYIYIYIYIYKGNITISETLFRILCLKVIGETLMNTNQLSLRFSFQDLLLLSFKTIVYNWAIPSCRSSDLVEKS